MSDAIQLSGISHSFDGSAALSQVALTVEAGETVALIGSSGSGKSTLLSLLDGRLQGWSGNATVLGRALSPARPLHRRYRSDTGFIFQDFALIERFNVWQNVMNGRMGHISTIASLLGRYSDKDKSIVQRAIADTELLDFSFRRVSQLSGGQRQRVAIARCLSQEPRLILADEPISNLDPALAEQTLKLITGAARKRGIGVVFSSHQPDLARRFADRIIGLKEGRVELDIPASALQTSDMESLYHVSDKAPRGLRLVS